MADSGDKDQKTEEATPKRREEAREKGQVALSTELVAGIGLCAGASGLLLGGGFLASRAAEILSLRLRHLGDDGQLPFTAEAGANWVIDSLSAIALPLTLVTLPAIVVTGMTGYLQVGLKFAGKAIEMDPDKINPVKGFGRLFSMRSTVRTAMAGLKIALITSAVGAVAWTQLPGIIAMGTSELGPLMRAVTHLSIRCMAAALAVIVLLGLVDMLFQRFQLSKDLRMSKQEVKDEQKTSEGDPHVKARVRQIQREMATRRMMDEVPKATVVVTNPEHYAVALKYERDEYGHALQSAPVCVAKGADHMAQRIKKVAAKAGIVCYEDVPLARALHAQVEIGDEIPEDLYTAVAAVLGYVLRLQGEAVTA